MDLNKNKLRWYSALATTFLLLNVDAGAEAIYTDIDPDVVLDEATEFTTIDMDNNTATDFAFLNTDFSGYFYPYGNVTLQRIWLSPVNSNNSAAGSYNTLLYETVNYYPFALNFGDVIDDSLNFENYWYQGLAWRTYFAFDTDYKGNWYPEMLDHYVGVRFIDADSCYHYGWIRCDVKDEGRTLVVKDYAYETKCDVGIVAGDLIGDTTTVLVANPAIFQPIIYSFQNTIFIRLQENFKTAKAIIYDLEGKKEFEIELTDKTSTIELNNLHGIFFVELDADDQKMATKIYLQ